MQAAIYLRNTLLVSVCACSAPPYVGLPDGGSPALDAVFVSMRCGDSVLSSGEECDDGNVVSGDGCDVACRLERCGDGISRGAEACDDANDASGDGCSDCTVEAGWECDPRAEPTRCTPICGDERIVGPETCDDDNDTAGDGCSETCSVEAGWDCSPNPSPCVEVCADGMIVGREECDDGMMAAGDGCDPLCRLELGWDCAGAPSVCVRSTRCGDGTREAGEGCDDGAIDPGDGCSDACTIEPGHVCWEGPGGASFCITEACETCLAAAPFEPSDPALGPLFPDALYVCYGGPAPAAWDFPPEWLPSEGSATEGPGAGRLYAELCSDLLACLMRTNCMFADLDGDGDVDSYALDCYCGYPEVLSEHDAHVRDCEAGAIEPAGPCARELEAAAGTTDPLELASRFTSGTPATLWSVGLIYVVADSCHSECIR